MSHMHYGASGTIFQFANALRKNMTDAENIVWRKIRKNQLGVRIRRQHPIDKYIADYYCHELKLVIEIDGEIYLSKKNIENDNNRATTFNEFGIQIIRFTNSQVANNIDFVIEELKRQITKRKAFMNK